LSLLLFPVVEVLEQQGVDADAVAEWLSGSMNIPR